MKKEKITINLHGNEDYSFFKKYGIKKGQKGNVTIYVDDKNEFIKKYQNHSKKTNSLLQEKAKQDYFNRNKSLIKAESFMLGRGPLTDDQLKNQMYDIYNDSKKEEAVRQAANNERNVKLNQHISDFNLFYNNLTPEQKQAYQWMRSHENDYNHWAKTQPKDKVNLNNYINYLNREHKGWQDTKDFVLKVGTGIVGGAGIMSSLPILFAGTLLPSAGEVAKGLGKFTLNTGKSMLTSRATKTALDHITNLDEGTKEFISNGIGFGVGFGSGNLLNRAASGVYGMAKYDLANKAVEGTIGNHWYNPVITGALLGTTNGITNTVGRRGTIALDKALVQNSNLNNRTKELIRDRITMPAVRQFNFGNLITTGGHSGINALGALTGTTVGAIGEGAVSQLPYLVVTNGISGIDNITNGAISNNLTSELRQYLELGLQSALGHLFGQNIHGKAGEIVHKASGGAKDVGRALENVKTAFKKWKRFSPSSWNLPLYNGTIIAKFTPTRQFLGLRANDSSGKGRGWLDILFKKDAPLSGNLHGKVDIIEGMPELKSRVGSDYDNAYSLYHKIYPEGLRSRRGLGLIISFVSPQNLAELSSALQKLNDHFYVVQAPKGKETRGDLVLGKAGVNKKGLDVVEYWNGDGHIVIGDRNKDLYYVDMGGTGSAGVNHNHSGETLSVTPSKWKNFAVSGVKTWIDRSQSTRLPLMLSPIEVQPGRNPTINNVYSKGWDTREVSYKKGGKVNYKTRAF